MGEKEATAAAPPEYQADGSDTEEEANKLDSNEVRPQEGTEEKADDSAVRNESSVQSPAESSDEDGETREKEGEKKPSQSRTS